MTALAAAVRDPRWMGQPPPTAGHRVPHGGEPRPQGAAEPAANNDGICRATARPLRPSPAAAGHWSITICPIDDVGQGPPVQIGAQIVAEQVDPSMLTHVTAARDMRGDEDALIVPEATIGFMFKLTLIHVEGHSPQLSRREGSDQRLFVDDFTPRHVHQDGAGLHGGKGLPTDQLGRLWCPLTTDHHAVALLEESIETLGGFQAAESGWQYGIGRYPAPRAGHPHAGIGAQPPHLL